MDFIDSATTETSTSFRTSSAFDFVKGFITGQIALLSLLFFIVRFLFFRSVGPVAPFSNSVKLNSASFSSKRRAKNKNVSGSSIIPNLETDSALLERLFGLDHQILKQQASKSGNSEILISDESARWLTFMLSKLIFDPFRAQIHQNSSLVIDTLQDKLNAFQSKKASCIKMLQHLENVHIKSVGIGSFYPVIDSYQLYYDSDSERCAFRMKCSWQDALVLEIESALSFAGLISLPFSVSSKLKNLKFTAQLQTSKDGNSFELTCLPDDNLLVDLEIGSLLGHRTKLKDLPKIKNLIVEALKKIISDTIINPKCIKIPFPNLQEHFTWTCDEFLSEQLEESTTEKEVTKYLDSDIVSTAAEEEEVENSITLGVSGSFAGLSFISDESEQMNTFKDSHSRYDDFDDDNGTLTQVQKK